MDEWYFDGDGRWAGRSHDAARPPKSPRGDVASWASTQSGGDRRSVSSCSRPRSRAESVGSSCPSSAGAAAWANQNSRPIRNLLKASEELNRLFSNEQVYPRTGYTPRKCRATRPGNGGAPLCPARPPCGPPQAAPPQRSSPEGRTGYSGVDPRCTKTERWREAGLVRWPQPNDGERPPDKEDVVPFRRTVENAQKFWGGTLWSRSLRERGTDMRDPFFSNIGGNVKELSEQWLKCRRDVPYSGSTVSGAVAMPREHDMKKWVDRPVAAGRYALEHMEGSRYVWDDQPRPCLTELPAEGPSPGAYPDEKPARSMPLSARF
eukprot:TRINITY_DN11003_c0_g2_i4.p1 TRINITY_DN11003_c0_g2~~TRINITY_DN11003_c0_g2_i4.p1  ORF type:complete len:320 (+),score=51.81 TRINITY_DN11003_c0_g2_i4:224-1183(+)